MPNETIRAVIAQHRGLGERAGPICGFLQGLAALALAAVLVACGGGDGNSATTPPPVTDPAPGTGGGTTALPVIVTQPTGATVSEGAVASFSVVATGSGALVYQWSRDGVAIAGATGSTYTSATLSLADSGASFAVAVTNPGGTVSSTPAMLTVVAAPAPSVALRLVAEPGPQQTTRLPSDGTYSGRSMQTGNLTLFDPTAGGAPVIVAAAGTWYPQASLTQADIDLAAKTVRNIRERYRLYLTSGQLMRLDLAAGATVTPNRVSTLQLSDLCLGPDTPFGEVFDDWTNPDASLLLYQAKPNCENPIVELTDRRYVAVKAAMSSAQAPIDLGAHRPLAALRDESGAITGFVLYDGLALTRVDADFANSALIAPVLVPRDDDIAVVGVFGPADNPYLLYHYKKFGGPYQLYAYRLNGDAAPTPIYATSTVYAATSDATGLYFVATTSDNLETRLFRLNDDLSLESLIDRLPVSATATILLTPSRYVVAADNSVLTSAPRDPAQGSRELFTTGSDVIDIVHAVGDDLYVALRGAASGTLYDSHVKLTASDFSTAVDLPRTRLLAPLYAAVQPLTRRDYAVPDYAYVVMAESVAPGDNFVLSNAILSRYEAGRVRTVIGNFPDLNNSSDEPALVPDANASVDTLLGWRYYSAYQFGQPGVITGYGSDSTLVPSGGGPILKLTNYF